MENYTSTGEWIPKLEVQKYYHTHPDTYDLASVKTAMDSRFPQGLPIQDLCPIPPDTPRDVEEPEEFKELPQSRKATLQAYIQQSRSELAIEALPDGQTDRRVGDDYARTIQHGNERYENLLLSDHKECYKGQAKTDSTQRRDVEWILSDTPLPAEDKLSQLALAHKWSGHGTSMVNLTLSVPTTYIYVISVTPLWGQRRTYTSEAWRAFFHLENARGKLGGMKHSL